MDVSNKSMETINQWQDWYRKHRTVAQLDEPGVSKDSKENLCNASSVTDTMTDWSSFDKNIYIQKAIEHFADTLCEFQYELTGEQFYNCFLAAATQVANNAKAEYDKTKQLVDILQNAKETSAVS